MGLLCPLYPSIIVIQVFHIPQNLRLKVIFANAYVGGSALRASAADIHASAISRDSIFFRYPETLVSVILCYRLEGAEAIWMDDFLGPFGVPWGEGRRRGDPVETHKEESAGRRRRRRMVVANSTRFPSWASELQYSKACIVSDVIKTAAAFHQVDQLEYNELVGFLSSN